MSSSHPPPGWKSYPYTVTQFASRTSNCATATAPYTGAKAHCVVVDSWIIHGVSHNYTDGDTQGTFADPIGPDTTLAAWEFFTSHQ